MTLELSMYFLSGVLFVVCCLVGVIWNQKNEEIRKHAILIESKANESRLTELDRKMEKDMESMALSNERLIDKLQQRHDKDLESVSSGFRDQMNSLRDQMKNVESNIIRQMEFMFNSHNQNK